MSFVKNLELDEIRNGFLVTSDRKRIWDREIELILEFGRVCEKYNLRWFAGFGTLLGAARHRGFVPWDDDVDLVMTREDYEKLKQIAPKEFKYPYQFDLWYENEEPKDYYGGWPRVAFSKIRDARTTFIEFPNRRTFPQGIWIDIFPLDGVPPFENENLDREFKLLYDLFLIASAPQVARNFLQNPSKYKFLLHPKQVLEFLSVPLRERGKIYEERWTQFDRKTKFVSPLATVISPQNIYQIATERVLFDEMIYLPFEEISLPAPKDFDKILTRNYGDWKKMVFTHSHAKAASIDVSYKTYFEMQDKPDGIKSRARSLNQNLRLDEMRNGKLVTIWRKKIWKIQLDLILELQRVCEKLDLKFWAASSTLFAAVKFHGFNPEDDFITLEMTREDFSKLEFRFPFRLVENKLMDDRTSMIEDPNDKTRAQGIFIEINQSDEVPNEIEYLPFESISIPVPKNYEEVLKNLSEYYPNIEISRRFPSLLVSADIAYEEYFFGSNEIGG